MQADEREIIRSLKKEYSDIKVFVEGLSEERVKESEDKIQHFRNVMNITDEEWLRLKAPRQLCVLGELDRVLPVENESAFKNANPISTDGSWSFDETANKNRENAICKNLVAHKGILVVVLGGWHDLSDNLHEIAKDKCKYIRVTPRSNLTKEQNLEANLFGL